MRRSLAGVGRGAQVVLYPTRPLELPAKVVSAGWELRDQPGYDWHGLRRRTFEHLGIQVTIAGRGSLTFEGETRAVEPGTAMLTPMPHDHRYWLPAGGSWEFVFVGMRGREAVRAARLLIDRHGPLLPLRAGERGLERLLAIVRRVLTRRLTSQFEASELAWGALMALLEDHGGERSAASTRAPGIARALALAQSRYASGVGVSELARAAGYSRAHFSRLFAASEGSSPGAHLESLRLHEAMRRLRSGDQVGEAARACGYRDIAYFCRAFRRALGVSPGEFARGRLY